MQTFEFEGKTTEEAIENACRQLKLTKDEIDVEIIEPGSAGIFGLVGGRKAKVKVTTTDEEPEPVEETNGVAIAKDALENILTLIPMEGTTVSAAQNDGTIALNIEGDTSGLLIGRKGRTLDVEAIAHNWRDRPGKITGALHALQEQMGYLDEDGYLFLCDRKRDMVISGGVNIYPAEIEAALITMDGVRDCAVFGIPDDEYGEQLCACIELEHNAASVTADDVRQFLRGKLANYKVPKVIDFVAALPREDSGKLFKRRLREPYWQGRQRRI